MNGRYFAEHSLSNIQASNQDHTEYEYDIDQRAQQYLRTLDAGYHPPVLPEGLVELGLLIPSNNTGRSAVASPSPGAQNGPELLKLAAQEQKKLKKSSDEDIIQSETESDTDDPLPMLTPDESRDLKAKMNKIQQSQPGIGEIQTGGSIVNQYINAVGERYTYEAISSSDEECYPADAPQPIAQLSWKDMTKVANTDHVEGLDQS